ncbi:hypothetical protein FHS89_002760 [Rubricella aquisinus]|uniref:Uncharacterized protein n=1 Tax=Rubricella aquisinus TaxID=2028108 RepID=A0A840WZZ2_9RHOB|nr:hypothetical protein [Rubricella aquisinus]MBB5516720.1 hypothetical protein [Rubricella aquisinus]
MSARRASLWVLGALILVMIAIMKLVTGPILLEAAEGQRIFDARFGYSYEEARAYLKALDPHGLRVYLGPQRQIDTIFPVLMALFVIGLTLRSINIASWGSRGAFILGAVAMAGFDLLENARVADMLVSGAMIITPEQVAAASTVTIFKFITYGVVLTCLVLSIAVEHWKDRTAKAGAA